jgi:hypothetical protein
MTGVSRSAMRVAAPARAGRLQVVDEASLSFIKGVKETSVPEVKLTRSRTGANGTATFVFNNPDVFEGMAEMGEITGMFMTDEEVRRAPVLLPVSSAYRILLAQIRSSAAWKHALNAAGVEL